jgi:hypothetical protein
MQVAVAVALIMVAPLEQEVLVVAVMLVLHQMELATQGRLIQAVAVVVLVIRLLQQQVVLVAQVLSSSKQFLAQMLILRHSHHQEHGLLQQVQLKSSI